MQQRFEGDWLIEKSWKTADICLDTHRAPSYTDLIDNLDYSTTGAPMQTSDKTIISDLKSRLPVQLGNNIKRIIVFGSRARGEGSPDSDLDIAILVDTKTIEIEKTLDDIAYRVMWDHDFKPVISLKVFSEKAFMSAVDRGFSFYRNVNQEGISV